MNEWISTEMRLPYETGEYLVYMGDRVTCLFFTNDTFWSSDLKHPITHVTHWKYLPAPPEPEVIVGM